MDDIYSYCHTVDQRLYRNGFASYASLSDEKMDKEIAFIEAAFLSNIDPGECALYLAVGRA